MQAAIREIYVDSAVSDYIVRLVNATRVHPDVYLGASPRGSLALYRAGQAWAAFQGRDYVIPDDIKALAESALAHRLIIRTAASIRDVDPAAIVRELLASVPVDAPTPGAQRAERPTGLAPEARPCCDAWRSSSSAAVLLVGAFATGADFLFFLVYLVAYRGRRRLPPEPLRPGRSRGGLRARPHRTATSASSSGPPTRSATSVACPSSGWSHRAPRRCRCPCPVVRSRLGPRAERSWAARVPLVAPRALPRRPAADQDGRSRSACSRRPPRSGRRRP